MNAERNVATVRTFLHMLELMDIDAWALLWAEDADHHYPFGTEMFPRHIKGRTEIHRAWQETPEVFLRMSFALRETWVDGDTVIARFDGECVRRDTGLPYVNNYLAIFRFGQDGLIRAYWEYFDPIVAAEAFGLADVHYRRALLT
jgi:ketosteroid isomerase-like protein